MKLISLPIISSTGNGIKVRIPEEKLDTMAIKWARRAEYYQKRKYRQLASN